MSWCGGNPKGGTKEEIENSRKIDATLKKEAIEDKKQVKILLLGPGESGKSTFFKQMKIIQTNGGFTQEELLSYKSVVYGNCITQMKVILAAMEKLGIELEKEDNHVRANNLNEIPPSGESWNNSVGEDIKHLWADKGVQLAFAGRDKHYQLNDSAQYFFDNIQRFLEHNYVPTQNDVLRARVRTTGIDEAQFNFDNFPFRMMDVGGQRTERRKWIHCFDNVTTIIFCTALSEYDQTLREDNNQNRMKESLMLFDEIVNSKWFRDTPIILFLNKADIFQEKIERSPLKACFPQYSGGNNVEEAAKFIQLKFTEQNQTAQARAIYSHRTIAVDTENILVVWKAVKNMVFDTTTAELGF